MTKDETANAAIIDEGMLQGKIHEIRSQKVMLDFELAEIYGYSTKAFNQQVQRNIEKFDDDSRFQLNDEETRQLSRSQNVTLNGPHLPHDVVQSFNVCAYKS